MQTADQTDISITPAVGKDNLPPKSALKQVLIVDDDPALLLSIRAGLEGNPCFRAVTAASGREALDIIDSAVLAMLEWQDFTLGLKEYSPPFPEPRVNSALVYLLLNTSCRLDQYGSSDCLDRVRKELLRLQRQNKSKIVRR